MDLDDTAGDTAPNQNQIDKISNILGGERKKDADQDDQGKREPDLEKQKVGDDDKTLKGGDAEKLSKVDKALGEPGSKSGSDDDPTDHAVTLKELAESMELETKELYDVEIMVGKDQSATLGELKDGFKELEKFRGDAETFETRKTAQDNEVMVAKRQIDQLVELGARTNSLHPEVLAKLEIIHGEKVATERRLVLSAIPEWDNAIERQKDFTEMGGLMSQYGFSQAEIEGELDHRKLKFMRDMARRENQIKNATPEKVGKVPADTGKGKRQVKTSKLRERISAAKTRSASKQQKVGVISELIGEKFK